MPAVLRRSTEDPMEDCYWEAVVKDEENEEWYSTSWFGLASAVSDEDFSKDPAGMFPLIQDWRELYFYHRMSQVFADLLAPRFNPGVTERNWAYGSSNFLPKVFLGSARFKGEREG